VPRRFRSAREAEAYVLGFLNYETKNRYERRTRTHDLAAFKSRLIRAGWLEGAVPTVHVSGTNGKGTVAALLERILRAGGMRTGLYASPHLIDIRERISIQGRMIPARAFARGMEHLAEVFGGDAEAGFRTVFEHLTALALLAFQHARVDRAVVEVGLGGRLDATNILPAGPAVLTPISLDHQHVLGDSLVAIAEDKARILKPGGRGFVMPQPEEAAEAIRRAASAAGVSLTATDREVAVETVGVRPGGIDVEVRGRELYGRVRTRLLGRHQEQNIAAAVAVAEHLLSPESLGEAVRRGLRGARLAGRLEPRRIRGRACLVDGGHNPGAAAALAETLRSHYPAARIGALIGMPRYKDHRAYLSRLAPLVERFVFARADYPRATDPARLLQASGRREDRSASSIEAGVEELWRGRFDLILIAGSFVFAGEVLQKLRR